jgi:hypothetical protein
VEEIALQVKGLWEQGVEGSVYLGTSEKSRWADR